MRLARLLLVPLLLAASAAWPQARPAAANDLDVAQSRNLVAGAGLLKAGRPQQALPELDKVIAAYEASYRGAKTFVFSSRSAPETLAYTMKVANNQAQAPGSAGVYSSNWANAYHLKAYALLDLGRPNEALAAETAAVELAPLNAMYLTELGQVQLVLHDMDGAMQSFTRAEQAAREFSPPEVRNQELTRALRSQAYVLVERRQLDEAEKLYRQCLEVDPRDPRAAGELQYIARVRQQQPPAQ